MAHVRQEVTLRLVGRLGGFGGFLELFFRLQTHRDLTT